MTRTAATEDRSETIAPPHAATPPLPIVSVIVVNYNYGRFLSEAVASVFAQTYPRVECIVVDNGSTDESVDVIDACRAAHPTLQVLLRGTNGGQSVACVEGLANTRGAYVIFLDADDCLLPHCIATHMQVHLSARVHVGFSFADMLQVVDDQVVLSTYQPMATYLEGRKADAHLLRPTPAGLGALWQTLDPELGRRVHLVSRKQKLWVWAPMSGQCFRRDALALFADNAGLGALMSQTDLYFAVGVNAVCGSILIDEPLFAYRLHGSNAFTSRAQMQGILAYDHARTTNNASLARRLIIDQLVTRVEAFIPKRSLAIDYLLTLRHLDTRAIKQGGSYAAAAVAADFDAVARAGSTLLSILFLVVSGASPRTLWRAVTGLRAKRPAAAAP